MNASLTARQKISRLLIVATLCAGGSVSLAASCLCDNAAPLYYQAFQLLPEQAEAEYRAMDAALRGADPNVVARGYLARARKAMDAADAATQIKACLWGIESRVEGDDLGMIGSQLRSVSFVIEVDARACAADGHYRLAVEKCLSLRRLAAHIRPEGDIGYLLSAAVDGRALLCVRHVLGTTAPETDTLVWLQGQLGNVQAGPPSPGSAMEVTFDDFIRLYEANPEGVSQWKDSTLARIDDEGLKDELSGLSEVEILQRGRQSYERHLASVHRAMASERPYRQNHSEVLQKKEALIAQAEAGDPVGLFLGANSPIVSLYDLYVRRNADFNAVRAAIEIYLLCVETGALPEVLPPDLPSDPFSGEDFEYETTDAGFLLRCRQGEIQEGAMVPENAEITWEYEFQLSHES